MLATSQESLRIAGEQVYRLCVLPVADGDVECANRSGASQLFAARAGAVVRGFTPAAENLAVVGNICRRLDGLPLAIELAAARLPLLGLDGTRERLDERFRVLPNSAACRRRYTFAQPSRRRCSSWVGSMKLSLSCVQGAMRWCGQWVRPIRCGPTCRCSPLHAATIAWLCNSPVARGARTRTKGRAARCGRMNSKVADG
ncbi:MAG: hypothetical protein KIT35_05340 [Piscinibacter sp.]|uniref:hypothetical protein n=1 Tax=Piscinibacter TaxID=1114981 RepID=UPI000FDDC4A4|nr:MULTISPECIES: hypothetical protein [Piscinibacter]MCW5663235.1 hypothetical protein [Piscinibacter sp.]